MRDFTKLTVWQKSHALVLNVYRATRAFPDKERYGLTSQMRRAASSIPANIAEGAGRPSTRDYVRFLHIAAGSRNELEYHLILACDLGLLAPDVYQPLHMQVNEVKKMLVAFTQKLATRASD
jgi:four helix bundle protein